MGTCNFYRMNYNMPLIVMDDLTDDEGNYDEFATQDEYDYAVEKAREFSETLTFYDVTIRCGYYAGFQFYVEGKYEREFDLEVESPYCIDNDDAHYYFDMCRSAALRKAESERRKIRKWLMNLRDEGYIGLNFHGCMSNGEGVYTAM